MDISMTNRIVSTATAQASQSTSDAINIRVLKKAIDIQSDTAMALLNALSQPPQVQTALATSGNLGTQLNTFA